LILEMGRPGGLLRQANLVENYPGFPGGKSGQDLAELFHSQLESVGGTITKAEVFAVRRGSDDTYAASSSIGELKSDVVIIATGTRPRRLEVPKADSLVGRRLFYDVHDLLSAAGRSESVVVYGGGDAAFDYGMNLNRRGHEVTLICRSKPRALPLLRKRAAEARISVLEDRPIVGAREGTTGIVLEFRTGEEMKTNRLLVACGRTPSLDLIDPSLRAQIRFDNPPGSGVPGLYLAGDVIAVGKRQVGIAVGSGISAAMLAEHYLREVSRG
jgi:thioredoxin reductase (NADPH)